MKDKFSAPVLDIKSITEEGVFSGYGSIFGNKDSGGDIVVPGAFAKSLADHRQQGTKVRMFWGHDPDQPIGKWTDIAEDGKGLYVEGKLNMGVQRGREAYALLKEGDIDGLSIGYGVIDAEPDEKRGALLLKQVKLYEVSVVSMAMNQRARVEAVKSLENMKAAFAAGETPRLALIEEYLRDGGFPDALATAFVSLGKSAFRRSESGDEANDATAFLKALRG